jgi:YVTN family beta-propeller protein
MPRPTSPSDLWRLGLAISPDGTRLYTANGPSNDVSVVDAGSLTVVTKVAAGGSPWGIAIVPR